MIDDAKNRNKQSVKTTQGGYLLENDRGDGYDHQQYNAWLRLGVPYQNRVH